MNSDELADAGREAAKLSTSRDSRRVDDPLEPAFAEAAVAEFSRLQREDTPRIYLEALEGTEQGAKDLDIDRFHGIIEVLQNADDVGIGADTIDDLNNFFEIKSTAGPMPNQIDLTLNEYRQAIEEKGKFFLSGGRGPRGRLRNCGPDHPEPRQALELRVSRTITLTGIRALRSRSKCDFRATEPPTPPDSA